MAADLRKRPGKGIAGRARTKRMDETVGGKEKGLKGFIMTEVSKRGIWGRGRQ